VKKRGPAAGKCVAPLPNNLRVFAMHYIVLKCHKISKNNNLPLFHFGQIPPTNQKCSKAAADWLANLIFAIKG
jgi:hypothetical protein